MLRIQNSLIRLIQRNNSSGKLLLFSRGEPLFINSSRKYTLLILIFTKRIMLSLKKEILSTFLSTFLFTLCFSSFSWLYYLLILIVFWFCVTDLSIRVSCSWTPLFSSTNNEIQREKDEIRLTKIRIIIKIIVEREINVNNVYLSQRVYFKILYALV